MSGSPPSLKDDDKEARDWRRARLIVLGILTLFPVALWGVLVWISYLTWNAGQITEPRSIGGLAVIAAAASLLTFSAWKAWDQHKRRSRGIVEG